MFIEEKADIFLNKSIINSNNIKTKKYTYEIF